MLFFEELVHALSIVITCFFWLSLSTERKTEIFLKINIHCSSSIFNLKLSDIMALFQCYVFKIFQDFAFYVKVPRFQWPVFHIDKSMFKFKFSNFENFFFIADISESLNNFCESWKWCFDHFEKQIEILWTASPHHLLQNINIMHLTKEIEFGTGWMASHTNL